MGSKKLTSMQKRHFDRMTRVELKEEIASTNRELDVIACSATTAAEEKREELCARVAYLRERIRQLPPG